MVFVRDLRIFPFKALRGIQLRSATVGLTGLRAGTVGDRSWMLFDPLTKKAITQRQAPSLALLQPSLVLDTGGQATGIALCGNNANILTLLSGQHLSQRLTVQMPFEKVSGYAVPEEADDWFSAFLRRRVRVLHQLSDLPRYRRLGDDSGRSRPVSLADCFPLSIGTEYSLRCLNQRSGKSWCMDPFRMNVIFDGVALSDHSENSWGQVAVSGVRLELIEPITRCKVIDVDTKFGTLPSASDHEAGLLYALKKHWYINEQVGGNTTKGIVFGEYSDVLTGGTISVTDRAHIVTTKRAPKWIRPVA